MQRNHMESGEQERERERQGDADSNGLAMSCKRLVCLRYAILIISFCLLHVRLELNEDSAEFSRLSTLYLLLQVR